MARFRLREAITAGAFRHGAGTIISDGPDALPGDKIHQTLSASTVLPSMEPLNAAATAMRNAAIAQRTKEPHRRAFDTNMPVAITGVDSIG